MKILIAEDNPSSRHLLASTLRKWGHEVVMTCDGAEAWQALQSPGSPRLVILDWMMPGMDGLEVCKKIRSQPTAAYVYILLLTARSQKEDIVLGLEAGADDYRDPF